MEMPDIGVGPDIDEEQPQYLEVLAHRRRREALAVFQGHEEPMTLVELTHHLTGPFHGPDPNEAKRLQTSLYHHHLPKLDDAGLVEFDPDEKIVTPTERVSNINW